MKLLEYKGKELLKDYQIPIQKGVVVGNARDIVSAADKLAPPYVLKAQVMAGGRGKAGGIKFAHDLGQAKRLSEELLGMTIKNNIFNEPYVGHIVTLPNGITSNIWYPGVGDYRQNQYE